MKKQLEVRDAKTGQTLGHITIPKNAKPPRNRGLTYHPTGKTV